MPSFDSLWKSILSYAKIGKGRLSEEVFLRALPPTFDDALHLASHSPQNPNRKPVGKLPCDVVTLFVGRNFKMRRFETRKIWHKQKSHGERGFFAFQQCL
jgi:hypothetical protein